MCELKELFDLGLFTFKPYKANGLGIGGRGLSATPEALILG